MHVNSSRQTAVWLRLLFIERYKKKSGIFKAATYIHDRLCSQASRAFVAGCKSALDLYCSICPLTDQAAISCGILPLSKALNKAILVADDLPSRRTVVALSSVLAGFERFSSASSDLDDLARRSLHVLGRDKNGVEFPGRAQVCRSGIQQQ